MELLLLLNSLWCIWGNWVCFHATRSFFVMFALRNGLVCFFLPFSVDDIFWSILVFIQILFNKKRSNPGKFCLWVNLRSKIVGSMKLNPILFFRKSNHWMKLGFSSIHFSPHDRCQTDFSLVKKKPGVPVTLRFSKDTKPLLKLFWTKSIFGHSPFGQSKFRLMFFF